MTILYLGYWGVNDPLTVATIFPHLKILATFPSLEKIVFVTVERDDTAPKDLDLSFPGKEKIVFEPLFSKKTGINLVDKIGDFVFFPAQLKRLVKANHIQRIISRGAPAGALAYLVWKELRIPFYVESFEPHADYMYESGVWKKYDPRYFFQKSWEEKQKKHAAGLMPVAENYKARLIQEGVAPNLIHTVPVAVNTESFAFNAADRTRIRHLMGSSMDDIIGIYVGKFGDIYYDEEAFQIFKAAFAHFGERFRLLLLSPNSPEEITGKLQNAGIDTRQVFITKVAHAQVPSYLSASDFAFSTIKPAPSRIYCSPTKNGEYWANGLPILLTDGVGDDSDIIKKEGGGAIFDLQLPDSVEQGLMKIAAIIGQPGYRKEVRELALKYRALEMSRVAYSDFLV